MTLKRFSLSVAAIAFCACAAYAINWTIAEWKYHALLADRALIAGERDISVKPETACPDPSEAQVFIIFGQSNAANHGAERLTAPEEIYDFFEGRCFTGDDPQFSATGKGGSPWPAFARSQRDSGNQKPILMANVAVGNTRIDEWLAGTEHAEYFQQQTKSLQAKGHRVAAFLFFQGESDRDTPQQDYGTALANIADMTKTLSPGTPLIVSDTSICGADHASVFALSDARASLSKERDTVHLGPNTDTLGPEYRADGCHFNASGLRALGALWSEHVNTVLGSR